ncbi:kynureninase [Gymnodinialimonas ceratoperidinii]|uniref:Kynureninase n=1 Tax=Gymnodinialimonas ceratoperidinii TaxID=2856823 RepID=A0A8F6TSI7_9RHOB|nr:kynureninase [Gymnodinialimonas ceratoperidinii]QXT38187.1 kynureninase [Gymnodinialimonas ceratoperidinii]
MTLPKKEKFVIPEGTIYLDGNSLGPLPADVPAHVATVVADQWGANLIKGWNVDKWMAQPTRVGDRIGRLIGAPEGTVVMGETLSLKVYQALSAALQMRPDRKVVLSDSGNFPTDLYMADGLIKQLDKGHELRVVAPEDVAGAIDETVAAVMITQVDYRTGRTHDMRALTEAAHEAGAVMIWDLAHSAGALPVDMEASGAEFAVGCTYKYLNGGPGAPAFIYVRPDIVNDIKPALAGWLGHEAPFAFDMDYRPGTGIERMRVGTPPVLQLSALEKALEVWDDVDMEELRAASIALSEQFIKEVEASCPDLTLASPRDPALRGSQVSFHFENGYAAMQALIARGVIGDFRAPDIMRFGFTPLYLDAGDVTQAVEILSEILRDRLWDTPEYTTRKRVT